MNKAGLVEAVRTKTGLTKRTYKEVVEVMVSVIIDSLSREEKVK